MKNRIKLFVIIAIVAMIAVGFVSCDNGTTDTDVVPIELQGTWINNDGYTITFTGNSFTWDGGTGHSCTITGLKFTVENNIESTKDAFPSGYKIEGTLTSATGAFIGAIGGSTNDRAFLNAAKDKFVWVNSDDAYSNIYVKQ